MFQSGIRKSLRDLRMASGHLRQSTGGFGSPVSAIVRIRRVNIGISNNLKLLDYNEITLITNPRHNCCSNTSAFAKGERGHKA